MSYRLLAVFLFAWIFNLYVSTDLYAAKKLRIAVLKYGTVSWELDVIKHHGIDKKAGVELQVLPLAGVRATKVALQAGSTDVIVTDWLWVSRQRTEGADFVFVPYSTAVGALMVPSSSKATKLSDLAGKKIGVAGGPLDKNLLLLTAYGRKAENFDLKSKVELVYGAPPLLAKKLESGELDAVLNHWHYCARLEAKGFRRLVDIQQVAAELGAKGRVSMLGYVFAKDFGEKNKKTIQAFLETSSEAKKILRQSNKEWARIEKLTNAQNEATMLTLRDRFREGVPDRSGIEEEVDAKTLFKVLEELGGEKLVGKGKDLADGTFWDGQR